MARNRFSLDLRRFVEKAQGNADQVVRKVALDLFKGVIMKSPVSTGRFRGNWQVGLGTVPDGPIPDTDPSGSTTLNKGASILNTAKAGGIVYLANSLPYAQKLEYGHSKQAPQGVVRTTVSEYQFYVDQAVRDLR